MSSKRPSEFGIPKNESVNLIVKECLRNQVTDPKQIAYILGTAQHESANFTRANEIGGAAQARRLGYEGGPEYAGRGFVQLTHKSNYETMDKALGLNGALIKNPDLAATPDIAARILVVGMRDGMFTGKALGKYVNAENDDFFSARRVVNGILRSRPETVKAADLCGTYAKQWEGKLEQLIPQCRIDASVKVTPLIPLKPERVLADGLSTEQIQKFLNAIGCKDAQGKALVVDGIDGRRTQSAVTAFQKSQGLVADGIAGPQTCKVLLSEFKEIQKKDYSLVNSIREKFNEADAKLGKAWDQASENISAALGFAAKKVGIDKADAVEYSKDLAKVAVLRSGPGLTGALAYVMVKEALEMPATSSLTNMHDMGKYVQAVSKEFGELVIPGQSFRR